ncbi:MAG: hypothetical protein ACLPID_02245 [Beijerinckiaceae bacterium]
MIRAMPIYWDGFRLDGLIQVKVDYAARRGALRRFQTLRRFLDKEHQVWLSPVESRSPGLNRPCRISAKKSPGQALERMKKNGALRRVSGAIKSTLIA